MTSDQFQVALICGSVREGRFGPTVTSWMGSHIDDHPEMKLDTIDLADFPIALDHSASPALDALSARLESADAFVIVTPEYNHSYPASLKLAIDSTGPEWRAKPIGFVSYGAISGGLRAVEHLRPVLAELRAVTIRETVSLPQYWQSVTAENTLDLAPSVDDAARAMLDELSWWSKALRHPRNTTPYPNA
ncbi:NADPH-dependent FMN reductase [Nocardia sp. IFM 10818]